MMVRLQSILLIGLVILGVVAGLGIGYAVGQGGANTAQEQRYSDLQTQFRTVNDSYLVLTREYNKLVTLKNTAPAQPVSSAPAPAVVAAQPTAAPATAAKPTGAAPAAQASTPVTPTAAAKPAATAPAGAKTTANFKALAIGGTGDLEGPPPQPVEFTDLSTGDITSWEWDFGDSTPKSTEKNPKHTYYRCPGEKELCTVKLKVCGPAGCDTKVMSDYLWISEKCSGC